MTPVEDKEISTMVRIDVADERLHKLVRHCLTRSFMNEVRKVLRMGTSELALSKIFEFYCFYMGSIRWYDEVSMTGLACAEIEVGIDVQEKGNMILRIPRKWVKDFDEHELMGIIAHELGHLHNQFFYFEELDVYNHDVSVLEAEQDADETAEDLGFSNEIKAMRKRIPMEGIQKNCLKRNGDYPQTQYKGS